MPLIESYAIIGDTHTAALVGADGSIDWLCLPRFDSAAFFAALMGSPENGRWRISPATEGARSTRRYDGDSLVLTTRFTHADGEAEITDFMPLAEDFHRADLVRLVRGVRGRTAVTSEIDIRFNYGKTTPWIRNDGDRAEFIAGADGLEFWSPAPHSIENDTVRSEFTVGEGDEVPFVLTWFPSHERPPEWVDPAQSLEETRSWWRRWAGRSSVEGPWRAEVMRSLITLKALTYSPTGGIVAAPTTSLPEKIGGARNWDYRYCWLRDAALTLNALMVAGCREEAAAWREWLMRAVAGSPDQMQPLYRVDGGRVVDERLLHHLDGYENSRPVREGNAAAEQFQLDVYGQVLDTFFLGLHMGLPLMPDEWRLIRGLVNCVARSWQEPDEGLWEPRAPRRHYTHSKVMAWVGCDRAIKMAETSGKEAPLDEWRRLRDAIRDDVLSRGYSRERGCFVQYYGGSELDASLLLIALMGMLPPDDPRVAATVAAIERDLCDGGLIRRYLWSREADGLEDDEGAFLACSFWHVESMAMAGRIDEAKARFKELLCYCNDVGLLAEEYDPRQRRHLGNFPQAFSHIALVNAAARLNAALGFGPPTQTHPE
jgi:GH15 family glucan-1,4-alpha-glucosidase